MNLGPPHLAGAVVVGAAATLLIDLWALFLKRAFGIPSVSPCLIGRWVLHMPGGTFAHAGIAAAPAKRHECAAGWVVHYAIGAGFALALVLLTAGRWLEQPTLLPALAFGVVTVAAPYLVMQPAFGLGVAASRTPHPWQARLKSLMTHTVFGLGLYLGALALGAVQQRG